MKPFDASKLRKSVNKHIPAISTGFNDPNTWISTGSYALNYLICGDFDVGIPMGKVTVFAGESGSGKSFICSGNVVREAQKKGIFVVLIDTENALDETWLQALGVDTSEDKILRISASMIDEVALLINNFLVDYRKEYQDEDRETRPKVLFVLDSMGMLLTPVDVKQFAAGDMKGNMGWTARQLKSLVKNCVVKFGDLDIGLLATNHTYQSQDMFDPDDKIAGGSGPIFAASQVIAMRKLKLKEDEDGNKISQVTGIRAAMKVVKSRFSKPFESVQVKIPYETGMNPYSGLFDLFVKKGVLKKPSGNMYIYTDKAGEEHKYFEKGYNNNKDGILDRIMKEWDETEVVMDEIDNTTEEVME